MAAIIAIVAIAVLVAVPGCSGEPADGGPWNLLLITLDTTRSDRLGCYGYEHPTSPRLDGLAERGILFERAVSPVPITLPAHATILTGLDPHEHGVRHNSTFVLDDTFVTAAEVLKQEGYATGAVLGAFPVDARFGLAQGFDHYDDDFGGADDPAHLGWPERRAADVTARALAWIGDNRERPFFHWAHYYDPHHPYTPPPPLDAAFVDPYDGEIAAMDAAIGELADGLERMGLAARTWIVVAGDHGEALGDHGEATHSMLVYGATQLVPLIVVPPADWDGLPPEKVRSRRIAETVRLRDVFATMLDALGCAPGNDTARNAGSAVRGRTTQSGSLLELAAGTWDGPGPAYVETLAPPIDMGWSELRGVRTDEWSYIRAPYPELYDLGRDPGERENLHDDEPAVVARLGAFLDGMLENETDAQSVAPDRETVAKLRALGYAAAPARIDAAGSDRDPKDLVHLVVRINEAMAAQGVYDQARARALLEKVLAEDPANPLARRILIDVLMLLGETDEALDRQNRYLADHPGDREVLLARAQAHAVRREFDAACADLDELLRADSGDDVAADLYVQTLVDAGRADDARERLEKEARAAPDSAAVHARRALFELLQRNTAAAGEHAGRALAIDPRCAQALAVMGEVLFVQGMQAQRAGRAEEARKYFEKVREHCTEALSIDGLQSIAAFRMGMLNHMDGNLPGAQRNYHIALSQRPSWADAHARMAEVCRELNAIPAALRHYRMAEELGFANAGFLFNYGIALVQAGDGQAAVKVWQRALAQDPPPALTGRIRANIEKLRAAK